VEFAEVSQFLDTPVKRYSSGMYVRLAFAVAAHLNPEILIVDEVLAVGDASFQKKCLGKMGEVSRQDGKTVLFVSHNMAAVEKLCRRCILLSSGRVVTAGDTEAVLMEYLNSRATEVDAQAATSLADRKDRQGEGQIRLTALTVCDARGVPVEAVASGEEILFQLRYQCCEPGPNPNVTAAISFSTFSGNFVTMLTNELSDDQFCLTRQTGLMTCRIPKLALSAGHYTINVALRRNDIMQDWIQEAAVLTVESGDFFGTGRTPPPSHGGVYFEQKWTAG
jgi:lipopolysaccharide transport system ATP-binding protein